MELKKNELYYTCENCKKSIHSFRINEDNLIFCSHTCREEYEAKEKEEKEEKEFTYYYTCENCKKEFSFPPTYTVDNKKFCSYACHTEFELKERQNQTYNEKEINDILDKAIIKNDPVKNPNHYNWIPGIECKDVVKHFSFHIGNAIKYLWRHKYKGKIIEDLQKAIENINCEIEFLKEQEVEKPQE